MVPVEFWGWVIPQVKAAHPDIVFIAEVYNPNEYRNYLFQGHFDYLYDKVGLYDTLRAITSGHESATAITGRWQSLDDIHTHMLNFLENHDEQRIASDFFAGSGVKGRPAMIVSATLQTNPVMIYFGQELGERGMDEEGFSGRDGRTTIFDYWAVDTVNRWFNKGLCNEALLTDEERELRAFYVRLLTLCNREAAIREGQFFDLTYANLTGCDFNEHRQFAYLRKKDKELLLIVVNFDGKPVKSGVCLPAHAFDFLGIPAREKAKAVDLLSDKEEEIRLMPDGKTFVELPAYGGKILKII
jgi:glycosidase